MENPIQMDDLGVPLFLETSKYFWNFHPLVGEMIQFDEHIFQRGLVRPPARFFFWVGVFSFRVLEL